MQPWQKRILDEQLRVERLFASETPISSMSRLDAMCAESYRSKHAPEEMSRRIRWLEQSYSKPNLALAEVE